MLDNRKCHDENNGGQLCWVLDDREESTMHIWERTFPGEVML